MECEFPFNGMYPCGKCGPCLSLKAWRWRQKLILESMNHERAWFVTLSYKSTDVVSYSHVQEYLKRLRRRLDRRKAGKIRFFCALEKGERNGRLHFHLIIFGDQRLRKLELRKGWRRGFVDTKLCSGVNWAKYVTKYITKGGKYWYSQSLGKKTVEECQDVLNKVGEQFPEAQLIKYGGVSLPGKMRLRPHGTDDENGNTKSESTYKTIINSVDAWPVELDGERRTLEGLVRWIRNGSGQP